MELCAFKQHLSILYYLLTIYDDEHKGAVWCRLVNMAQRDIDIDATVAFRTLKLMTEPPPPSETTEDLKVFTDQAAELGHVQGAEESATVAPPPAVTVNATWKRVHACNFEKTIKSQLANNICDDAKVFLLVICL